MSLFDHLNTGGAGARKWPASWPSVNRAGCKAGDLLVWFSDHDLYLVEEVVKEDHPHHVTARVRVLIGPTPGGCNPAPAAGEIVTKALDERYLIYGGEPPSKSADLEQAKADGLDGAIASEIEAGISQGLPSIRHRPSYGGAFIGPEIARLRKAGFDVRKTSIDVIILLPECP